MSESKADDLRWFWVLLESCERRLRTLCRKLECCSQEDLRRFHQCFEHLKCRANPLFWVVDAGQLDDTASEDELDDFAAWVVLQGESYFVDVLNHPDRIRKHLRVFDECENGRKHKEMLWDDKVDRDDYRGSQRADYIAAAIYRSRFGGSVADTVQDKS